jgi:periplasmic protein TonB
MTQPDSGSKQGREPRAFLATTFEEQPIWAELIESFRDRFFPPKLPPLELTSRPIPVPDRLAVNTNPWAVGTATLVNGGILALVLLLSVRAVIQPVPARGPNSKFHLDDFPLFAPPSATHGGNGGGADDTIEANKGHLPKFDMNPVAPVQVPLLDHPKLAIENAIAVQPEIKLPDNPSMTMIGLHNSTNVTLVSGGPGSRGGIGPGMNGGIGPGDGIGWGPGSGPGGPYVPGVGGVSQPIPIFTPEAEFSDEARRQKYQGVCMISVIIDAQGNPQSPRVIQRLGMGLDEKALEAVMKCRFKPARKDGKPVAVRISVMVNFRLF